MDFKRLFQSLPKKTKSWNVTDIEIWLHFISLGSLYPRFILGEASIDGSVLIHLDEVDLKEELKIKSTIIVSKIIQWISTGLREYDQYLQSSPEFKLLQLHQKKLAISQKENQKQNINRQNELSDKYANILVLTHCNYKQNFDLLAKETIVSFYEKKIFLETLEMRSRQKFLTEKTPSVIIQRKQGIFFLRSFGKSQKAYLKVNYPVQLYDEMKFVSGRECFLFSLRFGQMQIINQRLKKSFQVNEIPFSLLKSQKWSHFVLKYPIAKITKKNGDFFIQSVDQRDLWVKIADFSVEITDETIFKIGIGKLGEFVCNFKNKKPSLTSEYHYHLKEQSIWKQCELLQIQNSQIEKNQKINMK